MSSFDKNPTKSSLEFKSFDCCSLPFLVIKEAKLIGLEFLSASFFVKENFGGRQMVVKVRLKSLAKTDISKSKALQD